ncbi:MAG: hypothetical protein AAFZ58_17560, partial [Pseudomonadota bacterium]
VSALGHKEKWSSFALGRKEKWASLAQTSTRQVAGFATVPRFDVAPAIECLFLEPQLQRKMVLAGAGPRRY